VYVTRLPADHVYTGAEWSDEGVLIEARNWYALGKVRGERAAWDVMQREAPSARAAIGAPPITMAALCPTQCLGPLLQARLNQSSALLLEYCSGARDSLPAAGKCLVDVRDVAHAHIAALAAPPLAQGKGEERYLLIAGSLPWRAIGHVLRETLLRSEEGGGGRGEEGLSGAAAKVPTVVQEGPPSRPQALCSQRRTYHRLGLRYRPMEDSIADAARSLREGGWIKDSP
jgi:nucleoside-diphosphate-sugar epimerase